MSFHFSTLVARTNFTRHVQTKPASPSEAEDHRAHGKQNCVLRQTVHYHMFQQWPACDHMLVLNYQTFNAPSHVSERERESNAMK